MSTFVQLILLISLLDQKLTANSQGQDDDVTSTRGVVDVLVVNGLTTGMSSDSE